MLPALAHTVQVAHHKWVHRVTPELIQQVTAYKELQQIDDEQCHTQTHPQLGIRHH